MIKVSSLQKSFSKKRVLDGVSFTIDKGRIYGLIGSNGAGKSTLLKSMAGFTSYEGSILLDDEPLDSSSKDCKIGYMIESPSFFKGLSGRDNLLLIAKLYERFDVKNIDWALEKVGLFKRAEDLYATYSLGMKQRLYFAFAIMSKPDILLLDEPFNGVDPVTVDLFEELLLEFKKEGKYILISSHMIRELQEFIDGAFILDGGKIAFATEEAKKHDMFSLFLEIAKKSDGGLR